MKVLLFGDAPMALNEGGINQTLYNLFCFIKPENFLGITEVSQKNLQKLGSTEPYTNRYLSYQINYVNLPFNRFTKYLKSFLDKLNFFIYLKRDYSKLKNQINAFQPDVVISCSNTTSGILMHHKLLQNSNLKCPIIPYFMDDWMYNITHSNIDRFVNNCIKNMLQQNKNWMMISEELKQLLQERYQANPKNVLCIRNPVNISNAPANSIYTKKSVFTIAYAGALWPMHFDSFLAVAKAVQSIKSDFKIQLILYTQQSQWDWRKNELEPLGVLYQGHLPYNQIHASLNKADALLLTASFNKENYTHSKASLQTKITDYSKSKRLIISCAPSYSANNTYLKKNNCGICIETNNSQEIAKELLEIISNIENYQPYVNNAWNALQSFSQENVHRKIEDFLTLCVDDY